jgi:hypothetical protein
MMISKKKKQRSAPALAAAELLLWMGDQARKTGTGSLAMMRKGVVNGTKGRQVKG